MNLLSQGTAGALTAAALLLTAGCRGVSSQQEQDAEVYREIAAQLNPGGTSYRILNPRGVFTGIEQVGTQLYLNFTSQPEPPENAGTVTKAALHAALGWRLSGIEDIRGFGESSILISKEGEKPLYRDRAFLMVAPQSHGVLWALPGRENRPLAAAWENLPAGVDSAFEIDLNPGEACRVLAGSRTLAPYLENAKVAAVLGGSPEKLLDGVSGVFAFASIPAAASDKEALRRKHLMFSLPDSQGKLAELIRKGAAMLPGVKKEAGRIELIPVFGEEAPMARPVIVLKDGRIVFYTSVAAEKAFTAPAGKLTGTDEFKRLSAGLPTDGIAFFYARESYAELFNLLMEAFGQSFRMPEKEWTPSQFTVLSREGNNFLAVSNGDLDANQKTVLHRVVLPAAIAGFVAREYLNKNAAKAEAEAPDTTGECQLRLEEFKSALTAYAAKHGGAYPAKSDIEGIRELLAGKFLPLKATICPGAASEDTPAADAKSFDYANCSYVYFGGFTTKSNPKLPLVVDWPLNHKKAVNVLLVDGSIEKIDLETNNCKRIVGKLQAMYHYDEEEFQNLIKQADALDKRFELE